MEHSKEVNCNLNLNVELNLKKILKKKAYLNKIYSIVYVIYLLLKVSGSKGQQLCQDHC